MTFEQICMLFTMQEPYYGILLSSVERTESTKLDTIGVTMSGNVFKLVYNPKFIEKLPVETVLQILKHEMLHIAFNHFTLWNEDNAINGTPDSQIKKLRNFAEDLEINCYLDRTKIDSAAGGLYVEDFGFQKYEGTREYFRLLLKKEEELSRQKEQAQNPEQPCNGGKGGNQQKQDNTPSNKSENPQPNQQQEQKQEQQQKQEPNNQGTEDNNKPEFANEMLNNANTMDTHDLWPTQDNETESELLNQIIDDLIVRAAEETEKSGNPIPSELSKRISIIRSKKPKPVCNWKSFFRRYIGNEFSEIIRKSKKKESRRFPDAAGNKRRRKTQILVAIDTSGSINMSNYKEFMGQIRTLKESATFRVLECDTCIQHEYEFRGIIPDTVHGGGGTSFSPVINYFIKHKRLYDALVYFTDGCASIPSNTPKETLWVLSSDGETSDMKRYKVNGASVVQIKNTNGY